MHLAGTKHRLALPWLAVYSVHFDLPDTSELLTLFAVYTSQKRCSLRPSPDKSGGLNKSVQHLLAVYLPEFEIPKFFLDADLSEAPPRRAQPVNALTNLFV
jgi:hypothetical protein